MARLVGRSTAQGGTEALLTAHEAAALLSVSASYLAKARMRGEGPRYVKIGRAVRYRHADLAGWIAANSRGQT
jgi:predicted DNA-binding transcriptional regulator AlpA